MIIYYKRRETKLLFRGVYLFILSFFRAEKSFLTHVVETERCFKKVITTTALKIKSTTNIEDYF